MRVLGIKKNTCRVLSNMLHIMALPAAIQSISTQAALQPAELLL